MKKKINLPKVILIFLALNIFQVNKAQIKIGEAITYETSITGDFSSILRGGIKDTLVYMGMENLMITINTEKLGLWKGGKLFLHALNAHGATPSEDYVGDIQVYSNIEAGDYTGFYEYWYEQDFGFMSLLLGQHDLNSEFIGTKYGGTFINSSFGIAPSISLNVPVSIYPIASPCVLVKIPYNDFIFKIASYDGDPGDFESNRYNLQWNMGPDEGYMNISEVEYSRISESGRNGTYKFGGYYHSGEFEYYEEPTREISGNYGFYAIVDQMVLPKTVNPDEGLAMFLQFGYSPSDRNFAQHYLGGGFRYHGILPFRDEDVVGIAVAHIASGKHYEALVPENYSTETAIEFTYKITLADFYSIQPNVQYIIHPGMDKAIDNALVGTMRFMVEF